MEVKQHLSITLFLFYYIIGFIVLFWVFKYNWNRRWLYYHASKINGPFAVPLIGSAYLFYRGKKGVLEIFMNLCQKYGPTVRLWLGHRLFIILTQPKDVEQLLNTCLAKSDLYDYGAPMLGQGLLTALSVPKWKRHRKIISLTFNQKILNSYMDIFVKHANKLVDDLKQTSGEIDVFSYLSNCTLGVVNDSCMGVNSCEMKEQKEYFSWIMRSEELLVSRFFNPLQQPDFLWKISSASKEMNFVSEKAWNFVRKIVERRRHDLNDEQEKTCKKSNFLSHLIKLTDQEGKWTNEELMEEAQTMIATGSESSAILASFVMLMLAMHPNVQKEAYEEICTIFGNTNRDIDVKDLDQLTYLECIIKETLRLFPICHTVMRSVDRNVVLDSSIIPKGSIVLVPIGYIHRDPKYWPDPLKFDPNRFLTKEMAKQERYSYMPFSVPPRNCVGLKFAMMSLKTTIATILRHFELDSRQYTSVADIKLDIDIVLTASDGYKMTIMSR